MADPLLALSMPGDSSVAKDLSEFDARVLMAAWGHEWGERLKSAIKDEAPYRDDEDGTGSGEHLRDSIEFAGVKAIAGGISMSWTSDVPWAEFVITGTRPHDIYARFARMLHWVDGSGHDQFRRMVHHPGTDPNTFPLTALEHLLPEMTSSFAELFEEF